MSQAPKEKEEEKEKNLKNVESFQTGKWSNWATNNPDAKVTTLPVGIPGTLRVNNIVGQEEGGHGLVNIGLDVDGYGTYWCGTCFKGDKRSVAIPQGSHIIAFTVKEQGGFGIVDVRATLSNGDKTKWLCNNPNGVEKQVTSNLQNPYLGSIQAKEQDSYGDVDFRAFFLQIIMNQEKISDKEKYLEEEKEKEKDLKNVQSFQTGKWSNWATNNPDAKVTTSPVSIPGSLRVNNILAQEHGGHGIVNIGLDIDGYGTFWCGTCFDGDKRTVAIPQGSYIIAFTVKEQGGFGIVDLRATLNNGGKTKWLCSNPNGVEKEVASNVQNPYLGSIQAKEQGTYGDVDFRAFFSSIINLKSWLF